MVHNQIRKNRHHASLKSTRCITKPKWHSPICKTSIWTCKSGFLLVHFNNWNLQIAQITIKGGIQQVKRPIPTLVRKDLQPGVIQTQILTIRKEEALQNKRKPYHMGDKTCNQVEIKPEMTPCQSTIYKTTTVLLLHHDGLFIRPQVRSIAKIKATYIHKYINIKQIRSKKN